MYPVILAVGMRILGEEKFEGGNTPNDTAEIARLLDGKVDWVSTGLGFSPQDDDWQAVPMYVESGYTLRYSSPIRAAVKETKVGVVGRFLYPYFAERLIAEGHADMVAMTRAFIAYPELPNKAREGRLEDIRPCIGALQDCRGRMIRGLPISCTVNPAVSREKEWGAGTLRKTIKRKKILVIGAGPAGLETARIAAERGHQVVIYERTRNPGGQVLLAAKLPGRVDVKSIITWLVHQLKNLGVEIKYGQEITSEPEVMKFVPKKKNPMQSWLQLALFPFTRVSNRILSTTSKGGISPMSTQTLKFYKKRQTWAKTSYSLIL